MGLSIGGFNKWISGGWKETLFDIGDFVSPIDIHEVRENAKKQEFQYLLGKTGAGEERKTAKLLSVTDIVFNERSVKYSDESAGAANALTETLDTTTYPDKAILKLYNGRGFDVYLRSMTLQGKRIMQYSGEMGELIHDSLKRDDDIRRNGESTFEVGNEYIVTADQCARIADYWYKFLGKKKHLYSLSIPGCAAWYNVGDWYNLQVGEADTNEYIDAVVECYSVDVEKSAGGIGTTTLLLRDVEDNWSKTTLYETRLSTGGSPKRRVNRSNIVTVASSEYDGTYDYRCDGTDDDVQIQAAIDYVSHTHEGGTVQLTNGAYTLGATLTMKSSVILKGVGASTILYPESASITTMIDFGTATDAVIQDFTIDGDGSNITFITDAMKVVDGQIIGNANGITTQNYAFSCTTGTKSFILFHELNITNCNAKSNVLANTGTAASCVLFSSCTNMASCSSYSNSASGTNGEVRSFVSCTNISSCSSYSNSTTGTNGYVSSFRNCSNMASCSSHSNTSSGTNGYIVSYYSCNRITVCSTLGNISSLSNEFGYWDCHSVQQCKSNGDSQPYSAGWASPSYADSGTANPCADTAAGGYNS